MVNFLGSLVPHLLRNVLLHPLVVLSKPRRLHHLDIGRDLVLVVPSVGAVQRQVHRARLRAAEEVLGAKRRLEVGQVLRRRLHVGVVLAHILLRHRKDRRHKPPDSAHEGPHAHDLVDGHLHVVAVGEEHHLARGLEAVGDLLLLKLHFRVCHLPPGNDRVEGAVDDWRVADVHLVDDSLGHELVVRPLDLSLGQSTLDEGVFDVVVVQEERDLLARHGAGEDVERHVQFLLRDRRRQRAIHDLRL
mmetsp:Transcript_46481/g.110761  ORF Transcript_46481/g.110761 Transcript_46481/m.110761 type:complete len:246 (-) Transcript_46481:28-765(-)